MKYKSLFLYLAFMLVAAPSIAMPKAADRVLSLALPGYSQIKSQRSIGYVLLGTEAAIIGSLYYFGSEEKLLQDAAYSYAIKYADLEPGAYDKYFFKNLGRYQSSGYDANGYNAAVREQALKLYPHDPDAQQAYLEANSYGEDHYWYWQAPQHKSRYNKYRNDARDMQSYSMVAGGVLLLNHVINLIDYANRREERATQLSVAFKEGNPRLVLSHKF